MKINQFQFTESSGWVGMDNADKPNLVLAFGDRNLLSKPSYFDHIHEAYPKADIISLSTSGEIHGKQVYDHTISGCAISFEKTQLKIACEHVDEHESSFQVGIALINQLYEDGLKHVLVFSDGHKVNGSDLIRGLNSKEKAKYSITGGLAGDADRFEQTLVGLNQAASEGNVIALGLYGENIHVAHGSQGGWDSFGVDRLITKSEGNKLYELDGTSALSLYKQYLGARAKELPASALLFPLSVHLDNGSSVVRTILNIDEENDCMIFAGDLPQGSYARLMKANFDRLIDGASEAAENSLEKIKASDRTTLALLISCVGRKLVLGQRVEEEVEAVCDVLGENAVLTGFYSYGEISPLQENINCELHNQTMTITTLSES